MATAKVVVGLIVLLVAAYFGYRGYLETRVNTPFDNEKVSAGVTSADQKKTSKLTFSDG